MKTPPPKTLLIIDDDEALREFMVELAKSFGFVVQDAASAEAGLALAQEGKPTLIFCDVHMEPGDGREVLKAVREMETLQDCQFVLMTGDLVGASKKTSIDLEADDYLAKPFEIAEFVTCLNERYRQACL